MPLFGLVKKKKEEVAEQPPAPQPVLEVPLDTVVAMQQQGWTNEQIAQTLQRQGYGVQQIYDAIAQAEATGGIEPYAVPQQQTAPAEQPKDTKSFEEIAETIVEEKWQDVNKELGKFSEWKEATEARLDKLEQGLNDLKADVDSLHKAIIAKVGEYDKNIMDVGTEIKAMEKVFQKVLPTLTDNINELSRITKDVKRKK